MPLSPRARRTALPLLALVVGLVSLGTAVWFTLAPPRGAGSVVSVGGPFALQGPDGQVVSDKSLAGKPFLVFFGFTHCPDICPTKLFELSEVFRAMGPEGRDLRAYFVTVDPERDTAEVMKSYVSSFDGRIVGLTGDRPAIDAMIRNYRAYARKVPTTGDDYTMEHTSLVYLMGRDGRFVSAVNLDRPPADAAREILRRS